MESYKMGKRNNMIPNGHKDWQRFVKTSFNQPAKKYRRKTNRVKKARTVAPRPVKLLKPLVHSPTVRYHAKSRLGRGFTNTELKTVGLCKNFAKSVGISIDKRRRNKSVESLQKNVLRLKEYQSKLILFPLNDKKIKKGEATPEECKVASQVKEVMPQGLHQATTAKAKARVITEEERKFSAYITLRKARADARLVGIRVKRVKDAAENPDDVTKLAATDKKAKK
ncbi:large ribosomal subunit protein eL13-like isoform X2 [Phymastichus coffea]|uniref:large ribosomal subunit protein eL13-like isoform X2 n=1 Tax=Phymastichus coffea TaxID=108790 RepID=UPI00273AD8C1|nr:large ribosomal subunit protein eL13-like isoform X2 [Phymastichus coffea]